MFRQFLIAAIFLSSTLSAEKAVLAMAGSVRQDSYNKALAREAAKMAEQMGAKVYYVDLKDYSIPLYSEDLEKEQGMSQKAKELRRLMLKSDAIIIASPEYNASVTGVLKNAIDWASRTEGGSGSNEAFKDKKFAIMSASPGKGGGKRGVVHLQAIIEALGGQVIDTIVLVPQAHQSFDKEGSLTNRQLKEELGQEIRLLIE